MASNQQQGQANREDMEARARQGETVIPGGTGGKSLEAQEHLAEGFFTYHVIGHACMHGIFI